MSIEVAVALFAAVVVGVAVGLLRWKREPEKPQKVAPRDPWRQFYEDVVPHINGAVSSDDGKKLWVADEWYFYLGANRYRLEDYGYTERGEWFLSGSMCIDFSSGLYDCVTLHGKLKNSVKN